MQRNNEQKIPILLFLLHQYKFHEILKIMLNRQVSKSLLQQYGYRKAEYSKEEEFKLNKFIDRFSLHQIIQLKGSSQYSVKQYKNIPLQEMIRRKLSTQSVDDFTRRILWLQLSQFYSKKDIYTDLKILQISVQFSQVIQKDIRRTQRPLSILSQSQQVLQYLAQYNPYVGYCQGMNNIVSYILSKGFEHQQAFLIMKKIIEQKLPCDYYTNMDNLMAYTRILYQILGITHPQVYSHLKKLSKQFQNAYAVMLSYVIQWFVCLFCNDNICQPVTDVIWDYFLLDGVIILIKAAIAFFDFLQQPILKCNNFEQYNFMQKQQIKNIKSAEQIKKRISQVYISQKILQLFKQKLLQPKTMHQQNLEKKQKKTKPTIKKSCNKSQNVCFQTIEDNLNQNKTFQVFVYRPNSQVKIIHNYMETLQKQYFKNQKKRNKIDCIMIGRIPHSCRNSCDSLTEDSLTQKNLTEQPLLKTPGKSTNNTPTSNKSGLVINEQQLRDKLSQKINEIGQKKPEAKRSESVIFMQQMVKNVSISNLLQLYDIDQLFQ